MFGRCYKPGTGLGKRDRTKEAQMAWKCIKARVLRRPELHAMPAGENWPGACLWCGKNDKEFYEFLNAELGRQEVEELLEEHLKKYGEVFDRLGPE